MARSFRILAEKVGPVGMALVAVVSSVAVYSVGSFYMTLATMAFCFLIIGLIVRSKKQMHVLFMGLGIALDFGVVLTLEFSRSAINTVFTETMTVFQYGHVVFSTLAVLLYIPVGILGYRRFRGHCVRPGLCLCTAI